MFPIAQFLKKMLAQQGESPRDEEPYGGATLMKQNERLKTNMRPSPKNGNQKTIRTSYRIHEYTNSKKKAIETLFVLHVHLLFEKSLLSSIVQVLPLES